MHQDIIGWVRVFVPRYAARGQYEAMLAHNIKKVLQPGQIREDQKIEGLKVTACTRDDLITMARKGTTIALLHAHLLVEPDLRGKKGGTRQDFWNVLDALEAKGAILWELYTGLRTNKKDQRDKLIRDTIETLARGRHKSRKSDKRGRPAKTFTDAEWAQARSVWESRRISRWQDVKEKLPKGMSLSRAYLEFGARNTETE
jgi:hypothetical protein